MYYPQSQIKTDLYTNGNEYILSTTKENYIGNYYELSSGKKYTGKSPNNKPNILIQPKKIYLDADLEYDEGEGEVFTKNPPIIFTTPYNENPPLIRYLPSYNSTIPTQKDYDLGVFQRYFCKKNNELKYIEIDKTTFQQLNSNSNKIAWDLYSALSLNWYLTGDKSKVYNANKGLSTLIETKEKWYGFTQYFKDKYLKYYLES